MFDIPPILLRTPLTVRYSESIGKGPTDENSGGGTVLIFINNQTLLSLLNTLSTNWILLTIKHFYPN
jgi:hypothetical protein